MNVELFQLYEKRLDNCNRMLSQFKEGTWGHKFWSLTFASILRKMNRNINSSLRSSVD